MKYAGILFVSRDLERTKDFYWKLFGLRKISDFGTNITLKGGISFQTLDSWAEFLQKPIDSIQLENHASELFFEEDDMDGFLEKLKEYEVEVVHECYMHAWGARTIRFYDPDRHIIEVSESLPFVIQRLSKEGRSVEEIHEKTMLSIKMIERMLKK